MALDSDTMVMMHFNTSPILDEQGNTFVASGAPTLQIGHFRSAAYLNSSSSIYMDDDLDILSSDFTIDFWLKFDTTSPDTGIYYLLAFGSDNEEKLFQFSLKLTNGSGMVVLVDSGALHATVLTHAQLASLGTNWFHMAFVYDHTTPSLVCYVNGTATKTITSDELSTDLESLYTEYSGASLVAHYIDEFRISSVKRWTADFSVPTSEYGIDQIITNYQYTKSFLNFNENAITDATGDGHMWAVDGDAAVTTTNAKFTKALYSSGGSGYIQNTQSMTLGTNSNFMIDFDAYIPSGSSSISDLVVMKNNNNESLNISYTGSAFNFVISSSTASGSFTAGGFAHISVLYNAYSGALKYFINGTEASTSYTYGTFTNFDWTFSLKPSTTTIDNFRIMVGPTINELTVQMGTAQSVEYNVATSESIVTEDEKTIAMLMNKNENKLITYDDCGNKWLQYGGQLSVEEINSISSDTVVTNTAISPYNYLKTSSTINLGTGNFTIEFFAQQTDVAADEVLCEFYNTTSSDTITINSINPSSGTNSYLSMVAKGNIATTNTNNGNILNNSLHHIV